MVVIVMLHCFISNVIQKFFFCKSGVRNFDQAKSMQKRSLIRNRGRFCRSKGQDVTAAKNQFLNRVPYRLVICFIFLCNTAMADLDFFSRIYLSNKKYADNINVRSFLVTRSQLVGYFDSEIPPAIQQLSYNGLYKKKDQSLFLIVECRNIGERYAFGELRIDVPGMNITIPIYCHGIHGNMETFVNCGVIDLGSLAVFDKDGFPSMSYSWKELYTY